MTYNFKPLEDVLGNIRDVGIINPELSAEISGQKILEIKETWADTIISACQVCKKKYKNCGNERKREVEGAGYLRIGFEGNEVN